MSNNVLLTTSFLSLSLLSAEFFVVEHACASNFEELARTSKEITEEIDLIDSMPDEIRRTQDSWKLKKLLKEFEELEGIPYKLSIKEKSSCINFGAQSSSEEAFSNTIISRTLEVIAADIEKIKAVPENLRRTQDVWKLKNLSEELYTLQNDSFQHVSSSSGNHSLSALIRPESKKRPPAPDYKPKPTVQPGNEEPKLLSSQGAFDSHEYSEHVVLPLTTEKTPLLYPRALLINESNFDGALVTVPEKSFWDSVGEWLSSLFSCYPSDQDEEEATAYERRSLLGGGQGMQPNSAKKNVVVFRANEFVRLEIDIPASTRSISRENHDNNLYQSRIQDQRGDQWVVTVQRCSHSSKRVMEYEGDVM